MRKERFDAEGIPAILWGEPSERVFIHVHGKMSRKECAESFAAIAEAKGFQTLSFDLPEHGERTNHACKCDVWNGTHDLNVIADCTFDRWPRVSLFACSIGAYFSLQAYGNRRFEKALFQSPIVDMSYLVGRMMKWFNVTPEALEEKGVIDTPVDPLRWDYYRYILTHPTEKWPIPTAILYGGRDEMQSIEVMRTFSERFRASLTVSPDSAHPFMAEQDIPIVESWLRENIQEGYLFSPDVHTV